MFPSKYSPNISSIECESTDGNKTAKLICPGLEETKDSNATMATPDEDANSIFLNLILEA